MDVDCFLKLSAAQKASQLPGNSQRLKGPGSHRTYIKKLKHSHLGPKGPGDTQGHKGASALPQTQSQKSHQLSLLLSKAPSGSASNRLPPRDTGAAPLLARGFLGL